MLLFHWVGFAALTMVAGVAILFTGRYPKAIFNFNVGVMRWTWRVSYYAFSALGTDRYPPFSLTATNYPAQLAVDYPGRLSRGPALVKWWLLAIPHYLIVALLIGGFAATTGDASNMTQSGIGLIGVLVLVVGATLISTGRYPQGMFDLVIGLNRWVYRVIAYAALMTDDYPAVPPQHRRHRTRNRIRQEDPLTQPDLALIRKHNGLPDFRGFVESCLCRLSRPAHIDNPERYHPKRRQPEIDACLSRGGLGALGYLERVEVGETA